MYQVLQFHHLYDGKFAAFRGKRTEWQRRKIIFPSEFVPEEGKVYECVVSETITGVFHYEGEDFDVCYAHWNKVGSVIDVIDYEFRKAQPKPESPLALAFRKAGLAR